MACVCMRIQCCVMYSLHILCVFPFLSASFSMFHFLFCFQHKINYQFHKQLSFSKPIISSLSLHFSVSYYFLLFLFPSRLIHLSFFITFTFLLCFNSLSFYHTFFYQKLLFSSSLSVIFLYQKETWKRKPYFLTLLQLYLFHSF